jgi:acyl carrier protein
MTDTEQRIKALVEAKAGQTVTDLSQNLRDDLGLDSLDIVEVTMAIDHEFGICIPDSVWEDAQVATVQEMVTVTDKYREP